MKGGDRMRNRKDLIKTSTFFILSFLILLTTSSASEMGDISIDIEIATTPLHEWMPSITYNPVDNEFLVLWHTTGVREVGGERMYSVHAQRISPNGELLGEPFSPIESYGPERRILPRAAHNPFTNQYMVCLSRGQEITDWDPFITLLASDGSSLYGPVPLSVEPTKSNHANIVFNSKRRQYLVVYNDSRNNVANVYGVIVGEDGTIIKEDFAITKAVESTDGGRINAYPCYNPKDDTYLINWEDFRNASDWRDPGDIYGALLDGDGTIRENDIPMVDDYRKDDEGDQRVQNIVYNPHRNEFLASWWDSSPSLQGGGGVVGRIINADGIPEGSDYVVADALGFQSFPHLVYVEDKKMYFAVWDDNRNETPDTEGENEDVYAKWLHSTGEPVASADIPICTEERNQGYSEVAYNPVMNRFLIVWRDEVAEEVLEEGGSGHVVESGGNVMGKIYGLPSFLTGRVVEQTTGSPVEDALTVVIGPSFPSLIKTNIGGWFNIAENAQTTGTYLIMAFKLGYHINVEFVNYEGKPLQSMLEMTRWW
jgi:hypothetical protein